jgi:hypothetical protein
MEIPNIAQPFSEVRMTVHPIDNLSWLLFVRLSLPSHQPFPHFYLSHSEVLLPLYLSDVDNCLRGKREKRTKKKRTGSLSLPSSSSTDATTGGRRTGVRDLVDSGEGGRGNLEIMPGACIKNVMTMMPKCKSLPELGTGKGVKVGRWRAISRKE